VLLYNRCSALLPRPGHLSCLVRLDVDLIGHIVATNGEEGIRHHCGVRRSPIHSITPILLDNLIEQALVAPTTRHQLVRRRIILRGHLGVIPFELQGALTVNSQKVINVCIEDSLGHHELFGQLFVIAGRTAPALLLAILVLRIVLVRMQIHLLEPVQVDYVVIEHCIDFVLFWVEQLASAAALLRVDNLIV